ncbi:MAG: DJ-1/PfpI family protein [Puia sp.]
MAILTENGFEEVELTSPLKALKEAGATVEIISPQKKKVKAWNHDHWSIELPVDVQLNNASVDDYDALIIPWWRLKSGSNAYKSRLCGFCANNFWKNKNRLRLFVMVRSC